MRMASLRQVKPSFYNPSTTDLSTPIMTVVPYCSRSSRAVIVLHLLSLEQVGFVHLFSILVSIEPLVGCWDIEASCRLAIRPQLDVVEERQDASKRGNLFVAAVQAGFQPRRLDPFERCPQLCWIAAFAHQADAGHQPLVSRDQRIEIALQGFADVLLKIRGMAAAAPESAVGDGDRQAYLARHLRQRHGAFHVLERRIIHLGRHNACSTPRRCGLC